MPDEIETTPEPSFEPYECSLGTVIDVQGDTYIVQTLEGRTIGITANGEPSAESIEADIASPPAPVVIVPQIVTRRQLFLALLDISPGLTRTAIRAGITAESDLIEFDEAQSFERSHPMVATLSSSLGIDADDVFIAAGAK